MAGDAVVGACRFIAPLPHCLIASLLLAGGGCTRKEPAKRYPMKGQVLAADAAKRELTINHEDIPDLMPAMTMTYPVASPALMQGRVAGETITATLEVQNASASIVEITHVGTAPLPAGANLAAGILDAGDEVPDAAFIDQANRRRSLSEWKGTAVVLPGGIVRYTPVVGQTGEVAFTYTVADGRHGSGTAKVVVTVTPPALTSITSSPAAGEGSVAVTRETIVRMEAEAASNLIESLTGAPTGGGRPR